MFQNKCHNNVLAFCSERIALKILLLGCCMRQFRVNKVRYRYICFHQLDVFWGSNKWRDIKQIDVYILLCAYYKFLRAYSKDILNKPSLMLHSTAVKEHVNR